MNALPHLPPLLRPAAWLRLLGLTQQRCLHCLRPFSPFAAQPRAASHGPKNLLCPACRPLFHAYAGPRCPACGLPPPDYAQRTDAGGLCGRCLTAPPPWRGLAFYGLYQGELRHLLLRLKFDGHLYLAPLLAALLHDAARHLPPPDALLAVPQHPAHLRRRGYNQAHELAKALAHRTGLPLRPNLLRRVTPGPAQSGLTADQRRANVRHSFAAAPEARGLHLWLLDDVMTTGSTLRAAVSALLTIGATTVDVLAVARTPRNGHNT